MKTRIWASLFGFIALALPGVSLADTTYTMASQPDDSYFCSFDWRDCFTRGDSQVVVKLGPGSNMGDGWLQSLTIEKDASSTYVNKPWLITFECFTDLSYTIRCPDWIQPLPWNAYQTFVLAELASSSPDKRHWTATFLDPTRDLNYGDSPHVKFRPDYYYELIINDDGWEIGAYGSKSLSLPYYKITGVRPGLTPVVIIPGILGSWQTTAGQWVLDPMSHIYDNLAATLEANGYVENQTLFKFPYDWERSNVDTAKLLAQKISEIKTTCNCDKVDLVAHSMGGLVATQYIESSDYAEDVNRLIMLGTPLAGSPQAYRTWEGGQFDFGDPRSNFILGAIFSREAKDSGYGDVASYLQNKPVPSVQELLPISHYLTEDSVPLQYPTGYPRNTFLENLIGDSGKYISSVLNRVQVTVVAGDVGTTSTIGGYIIKPSTKLPLWKDGEPISTTTTEGDDTVPLWSASYFSQPALVIPGGHHGDLASSSEAFVVKTLTGTEPTTTVSTAYPVWNKDWLTLLTKMSPFASDFPPLMQTIHDAYARELTGHKLLFLSLFSPIDVRVTAPDGTQIGKDFTTGASINQIPNSVYSGPIGEHEYVVIEDPLPGQYKVETIGTGDGAYTVAAGLIDAVTGTSSMVTGTTIINQIIANTLLFSSTSTTLTLVPPAPPLATSTPTTTLTADTCITDMQKAFANKWIRKKLVADNLVLDCKALKQLFKDRDAAKTSLARMLVIASIKLVLADMDFLAKDKGNTKDAVNLITMYTTWFRNHELQ